MLAKIHIKNLRLRTYIGFNEEEKIKKQDVVINLTIEYDAAQAMQSDKVDDAYNYKILTKKVINLVESRQFNLLEKMASEILALIKQTEAVVAAQITIDKPHALRFSDSVALQIDYRSPVA